MDGPVLIDDGVTGRYEGASQRSSWIQRFAVLLEGDDAQPVGACNGAGIRWQGAGQQLQQSGLSTAVRAQKPDSFARAKLQVEIRDDRLPVKRFAEPGRHQKLFGL